LQVLLSEARSLMAAILADDALSLRQTLDECKAAQRAGLELMGFLLHRHRLNDAVAYARAARWAGLAYEHGLPDGLRAALSLLPIDGARNVRAVRIGRGDAERLFAAPPFAAFIALRDLAGRAGDAAGRLTIVPPKPLREGLAAALGDQLTDAATRRLAQQWPEASGRRDLTLGARLLFIAGLLLVAGAAFLSPLHVTPLLLPLVGCFLFAPALLRIAAVLWQPQAREVVPPLGDDDLPVYSVLVPLRDEAQMVPQLARALLALDYPRAKLDVKFVVEARSRETVAAVRWAAAHAAHFELVTVPDGLPRTKPKALNFALPLARGDFLVIYDAEDIPDPGQLRRAASRFAAEPDLQCLQAELVVDNARESWLAALFAGEYAGQFGLMLPLLARLGLPMPLGGTSNHFRTSALRAVGGWDPFNVTEDADLGVRLSRLGLRTGVLDSVTREEAPVALGAWMAQRTRWMKGWMQTFIVHNRAPGPFLRDIGLKGFLAFQIYVGSMIVSALLHTAFLAGACIAFFLPQLGWYAHGWSAASLTLLLLGYGGAAALVVAGLVRIGRRDLLARQLLLPVYWALHSAAVFRAGWELLTRPHFWAKTRHGVTRVDRVLPVSADPGVAAQAE
jgi:glycosyltransferase XagB